MPTFMPITHYFTVLNNSKHNGVLKLYFRWAITLVNLTALDFKSAAYLFDLTAN